MKKQLLIAGGTGLIGRALQQEALQQQWEVTLLSRTAGENRITWNPDQESIELANPLSFDAIVNLAGTSIADGRWTRKRKNDIRKSRIQSCRTLEKYLREGGLQTPLYIGVSAIGIYGDRGSEQVDDLSPISTTTDWLAETVYQWETAHRRMELEGVRTVVLRIGLVLSTEGGALHEILQTARFGFLAYFGTGRQIWPWIHIGDVTGIMMYVTRQKEMRGTYQVSAPDPVSNKKLITTLSQLFKPARLVVPAPVVILSILLGQMHQMLMQSCNAVPTRLLAEGYIFRHTVLSIALKNLLEK